MIRRRELKAQILSDTRKPMSKYRVTVDTGGTFSDFVFFNEDSGEIAITLSLIHI